MILQVIWVVIGRIKLNLSMERNFTEWIRWLNQKRRLIIDIIANKIMYGSNNFCQEVKLRKDLIDMVGIKKFKLYPF